MSSIQTPVLIVGAGPTGLVMANLLGMYGIPTVIIEHNASVNRNPRSTFVDDECMRLLATLGLTEKLSNQVFGPITFERYSPLGFLLSREEGIITDHNYPTRSALYQPWFDQTLADGLKRFDNVQLEYNCKLIDIKITECTDRDRDLECSVEVVLEKNEVQEKRIFSYVLGADGNRSKVRDLMGITFDPVTPHENQSIRIDVEGTYDTSLVVRSGHDLTRMWMVFPAPNGRRFSFSVCKGENPDDLLSDTCAYELIKPFVTDKEFENLRIVFRSKYTFRSRLASKFSVDDRVFLLGDAAHTMPPAGSQGLNSGVRDANSLAWKLALVYKGICKPELLKYYEVERMESIKKIIKQVSIEYAGNRQKTKFNMIRDDLFGLCKKGVNFGYTALFSGHSRIFCDENTIKKQSHVATGRSTNVTSGFIIESSESELVGKVIPNPWVEIHHTGVMLDQLLGTSFSLVYMNETQSVPEELDIGVECKQIVLTRNMIKDHRMDKWWTSESVLLVRPDRIVAGVFTKETLNKCTELVQSWLTRQSRDVV
jgi:3-(3-hydroxy-phenyl)propionate hydroxylase